jgi:hypothetical protein
VCMSLQTVLPELIANYREIEGDREMDAHIVIVIITFITIIITFIIIRVFTI